MEDSFSQRMSGRAIVKPIRFCDSEVKSNRKKSASDTSLHLSNEMKRKRLQAKSTSGASLNSSSCNESIESTIPEKKMKRKAKSTSGASLNSSIDFGSPIAHSFMTQPEKKLEGVEAATEKSGNSSIPEVQTKRKRLENIDFSSSINEVVDSTLNTSVGVDVAKYHSDTEYNLQEAATKTQKRRKKVRRDWTLVKTFQNPDEAVKFVKSEKIWSTSTTNYVLQGRKVLYRCKNAKERGIQCEAGVSLLFCIESDQVILHRANNQHTCDRNPTTHTPMTDELKQKITALFLEGYRKRKEIETELAKAKLIVPSKSKLNNLITALRKEHYGSPKMTLAELEVKILENLKVPEDEDEAFIVDYVCNYDQVDFKIFISTKRLLRNAIDSYVVSADSTYKMTWQGYPISPVGTTDMDRHFHLFGIVLSQTENSSDYEFMFRTLKSGVQKLFQYEMEPRILISDASGAIHNGFLAVFGDDILILMCWFHAKKAVKKNLPRLVANKNIQASILNDMDKLQVSQTPEHFRKAAALFLKKYEQHVEFCKYFNQQWLVENPNWYEGATTEFSPSTNNAMESWNRLCKDEKTKRVRLPLDSFFPKMFEWTKEWSQEYPSQAKTFVKKPTVDTELWTDSYKWARLNKVIKGNTDETTGLCYYDFTAGLDKSKPLSTLPNDWKTFDDFKKVQLGQWRTYMSADWENATCNCPVFKKRYICKHCVGLAIRLKYVQPPLVAKALPLEKKRKPGRPSNTKPALERQ